MRGARLFLFGCLVLPGQLLADHVIEDVWTFEGNEFTSQSAACNAVGLPDDTASVRYISIDPAGNSLSVCEQTSERCVNTFNGANRLLSPCDGVYDEFVESINSVQVGYSTRVAEHDDTSCADRAGDEIVERFSHYFDTPRPDISGFQCYSGCAMDTVIQTDTEYVDFGDGFEPSVEHYVITGTINGNNCGDVIPRPVQDSSGPREEDPPCTADYYTSPVTGEIVCGTPPQTTVDDNGTKTTTETLPDGTEVTEVTTPDGKEVTTTKHPDGSTTSTTTNPDGSTTSEFDREEDENDDECPENKYTLVAGQLVCSSSSEASSGDDELLDAVNGTNSRLDEINEKLEFTVPDTDGHELKDLSPELEASQLALNEAIEEFGSMVNGLVSLDIAAQNYSCDRSVSVIGVTLTFCVPPESLELVRIFGLVVLLAANITAGFIIVRAV